MQITVVIPCYNQANYLGECLQSVLDQTVEDWEAIIIDDASTVGDVSKVVNSFQDKRIKYIRHGKNRGLAAARNTGTSHASAQIIVPLDADDRLHPKYFEVVLEYLGQSEYDFVYFDVQCFGESTDVWYSKPFDVASFARERQFILGATPHLKQVWEKCGGWCDEDLFRLGYEDGDFWLSAVRHGCTGIYVAESLYYYRISSSSMAAKPRIFILPVYRRMYNRNKELIDTYSSYNEWMALGWLEVAGGYLKLHRPILALGCCLWVLLISSCNRRQAVIILKSSLVMIKCQAKRIFDFKGLWKQTFKGC